MDQLPLGAVLMAGLLVLGLLSFGLVSSTGAVAAQSSTAVSSCTTISESGEYTLTENISDGNGTCIEITASDVVFDGNGHTIDGGLNQTDLVAFAGEAASNGTFPWEPEWANHGVAVNGGENVTIRNATVTDWFFGVSLVGVSNGQVQDVTVRGNGDGISGYNGSNITVSDGRSTGNYGPGVVLDNVTDATAREMSLTGNLEGVMLAATTSGSIEDNVVRNNQNGVFILNTANSTIRNNTISGSYWAGIVAASSSGNQFSENTIEGTRGEFAVNADTAAIVLLSSSDNRFSNTTIRRNDANWTVYAINGSLNNTGSNVAVDGASVEFTLSNGGLVVQNGTVDITAIDTAPDEAMPDDVLIPVANETDADRAIVPT